MVSHVNDFIEPAVGLYCWWLIPTLLLFQGRIEEHLAKRQPTMKNFAFMSVIGLFGGFLVGITSVGSGSIIMMLLLLFYSFAPKIIIGTDISCPRSHSHRASPACRTGSVGITWTLRWLVPCCDWLDPRRNGARSAAQQCGFRCCGCEESCALCS